MVRDPLDEAAELAATNKRRREATTLSRIEVRRRVMQAVRAAERDSKEKKAEAENISVRSSAKSRSTRSLSDIMGG